jgi:hypothetical protein
MRTITRQQLKAKLDAGEDIKLVMTVGGWTFRASHIPGSLGFPSPGYALRELRCDDKTRRLHAVPSRPTAIAMSAGIPAGWLIGRTLAIRWRARAWSRPPWAAGPTGTALVVENWTAAARIVTTAGRATAGHRRQPRSRDAGRFRSPR